MSIVNCVLELVMVPFLSKKPTQVKWNPIKAFFFFFCNRGLRCGRHSTWHFQHDEWCTKHSLCLRFFISHLKNPIHLKTSLPCRLHEKASPFNDKASELCFLLYAIKPVGQIKGVCGLCRIEQFQLNSIILDCSIHLSMRNTTVRYNVSMSAVFILLSWTCCRVETCYWIELVFSFIAQKLECQWKA